MQAQVHAAPVESSGLKGSRDIKVYPASDSEDVFYEDRNKTLEANMLKHHRRASCDSLSTTGSGSRHSSIADGIIGTASHDARKTLVFLIGTTPTTPPTSSSVKTQRSWETFPRSKNKRGVLAPGTVGTLRQLKKADSFEGHEEAVRTLVAAVQETRSQMHQQQHHQHRYHRKTN